MVFFLMDCGLLRESRRRHARSDVREKISVACKEKRNGRLKLRWILRLKVEQYLLEHIICGLETEQEKCKWC